MAELVSIHQKYEDVNAEFNRIGKTLSSHNSALLHNFYEKHYLKEGLSKSRAIKSLITLRKFAEFTGKPLDKITEKQIEAYNIKLVKDDKSLFTISDYKKIIKCWLRFLGAKKNWNLINSRELKCKNPYGNGHALLPSDLPSDEEVLQIFSLASSRLRCVLSLCEGAGFRISEAATMRIKDLKWNEDGSVHATARQSKSQQKTVLVRPDLAYYIKAWLNTLPENNEDFLLFADPKKPNQPIQYATINKELKKIGEQLGLRKKRKMGFHAFRHRHATWALGHMNPIMAKLRIWNNKTTRMDGVYGAFSNEQVDEEFRKANGDVVVDKPRDVMKENNQICFKCKVAYPGHVKVCPICSRSLDVEKMINEKEEAERVQVDQLVRIIDALLDERLGKDNGKLKTIPILASLKKQGL
ncbi:MAG: site-specific integrase [Candidatus Diapherotrites archaeon]